MAVNWNREDNIAIIWIDNPPVNAMSHSVRERLSLALNEVNADTGIEASIIACRGKTFVAGADVKEFGKPPLAPFLNDLVQLIEDSAKPVIAAIHGKALGGGFEIALAAHGRIAAPDAQFGLPEVKLGIIPGAGGTQRLPRLIGVAAAIDMIATGKSISAPHARNLGLIDIVSQNELIADALAFARTLIHSEPRRTGQLPIAKFDEQTAELQILAVEQKARGQISPGEAARMVLRGANVPIEQGLKLERDKFLELVGSEQAVALRHVFVAERLAAKFDELADILPRPIQSVGIAGAGLMGAGIAVTFADADYDVTVVERDTLSIDEGQKRVDAIYERAVKSGRISNAIKEERLTRISFHSDLNAFTKCDLVIEAVFDDLGVKRELFTCLASIVRPDTILATNTSYLDPDAIASVVPDPSRFIGLHFFSPANMMRLVEVVKTKEIAPDVLATGLAVAKRLGKLGIVSGVCEGFIGNRLFTAYREQCDFMLEDGALPHEIDNAVEAYGFPMGPYAVTDLAGLDISWARRKRDADKRDPALRYVPIADRLCEAGRFGQKSGSGYYIYDGGRKLVDPIVTALIEAISSEKGIIRRPFEPDEIIARIIAGIVTEADKILSEGISLRPSDIDLVLINGYGYPAWCGGPMFRTGRAK
ncbi:3-hydroxyacyl-CoA dehydrogenase NAD-binding domain-containing protein [Phyllobacterium sp. YR531]|uniref:3-hydroxyacyl-CoA dehydrogenase NAD-binding domain-containing protein n=1 Tax=Phyllobacterium sp. YR531 TaxID=1144343 RepID=UPI00026F900A|nr:3-hydroxyacyl-CoA dehydrogenase NAD-binding domain-containing protein [Phyllobacterium sp. YR531]EJN02169.1 3-hydroxyacyl-CoA dehydrogenase [Phyllobacterium sp. YR531]